MLKQFEGMTIYDIGREISLRQAFLLNKLHDVESNLQDRFVKVTFVKSDGSQRTMVCTKNIALAKANGLVEKPIDPSKQKTPNDEVFTVWEMDKGWKSFRKDSILNWM